MSLRYPLLLCLALWSAVGISRGDEAADKTPKQAKPADAKPADAKPADAAKEEQQKAEAEKRIKRT